MSFFIDFWEKKWLLEFGIANEYVLTQIEKYSVVSEDHIKKKYIQYWYRYMKHLENKQKLDMHEKISHFYGDDLFFEYVHTRLKMLTLKEKYTEREKEKKQRALAKQKEKQEKEKKDFKFETRKRSPPTRLATRLQMAKEIEEFYSNDRLNLIEREFRMSMKRRRRSSYKMSLGQPVEEKEESEEEPEKSMADRFIDELMEMDENAEEGETRKDGHN